MDNLTSLEVGQEVIVKGLEDKSQVKKRLLEMGITPGAKIKVSGKAPMGDPIEIIVRGYKLTLRKDEASAVLI